MTDASVTRSAKTPVWFYLIAAVAVLWNGMGAFDYVMTQYRVEAYMGGFTQEQLEYFYGFPAWHVAVWAMAVWSAVAASLLLFARSRLAGPAFLVSTVFYVISAVYLYGFTRATDMMGSSGAVFSVVIFVSLVGLWWFSRFCARKGWLA